MKLLFYSCVGMLASVSWAPKTQGQPARYIGRTFDLESRRYKANEEPFKVEQGTKAAARCIKLVGRGEIFPADEETSKLCGLSKHVHIKRNADGEWERDEKKSPSKKRETKPAKAAKRSK